MDRVQLEEYQSPNQTFQKSGIVNFLIEKGIIKTEKQGTYLLSFIAIISIIITASIIYTTFFIKPRIIPGGDEVVREMESVPLSE